MNRVNDLNNQNVPKIQKAYEKCGCNYADALERFGSETLVEKIALKFLDDDSFSVLEEKMKGDDIYEKFRAAHGFKGVCANLGFSSLFELASKLTEKFRAGQTEGTSEIFKELKNRQEILTGALREAADLG